MNYIYASEYCFKLYEAAIKEGYAVRYLNKNQTIVFNPDDRLLIEQDCGPEINTKTLKHIYYLTEIEPDPLETHMIFKYQSIQGIINRIFIKTNQVVVFLGQEAALESFLRTHDFPLIIDMRYMPESETNLKALTLLLSTSTTIKGWFAPMNTYMDFLKPPETILNDFINLLKHASNTLIYLDSIKGNGDALLLEKANKLILSNTVTYMNETTLALSQIYPTLKIETYQNHTLIQQETSKKWPYLRTKLLKKLNQKF